MNADNIKVRDISERTEFNKFGETFKMVKSYGNHVYLFKRASCYELVRGVKTKTGNKIVYKYPNSEAFGSDGYTITEKMIDGDMFNNYLQTLLSKEN